MDARGAGGTGGAGGPDDPILVRESDALALLAHLVTSAEISMVEPYDYGVFRLIDAASRLATSMVAESDGATRDFLEALLAQVHEKRMGSTLDRERYGAFLRETSRMTAEHIVRTPARPARPARPAAVPEPPLAAPAAPAAGKVAAPADATPEAAETVLETIRRRRVTRAFADRPVADASLALVLEAARWATSGGGRRVHPMLVVRDPATIVRLRAVTPGMFSSPPVVIVVCTDAARAAVSLIQLERDATTWIDVGTAAMNMMVAAEALGLGACPVTSFSHAGVSVVLGLPATVEPELFLLLGHPEGPARAAKPRPRGAAALPDGLVWWERPGRTSPDAP
jgi:nitroreductase